jgi:hypothetical protein
MSGITPKELRSGRQVPESEASGASSGDIKVESEEVKETLAAIQEQERMHEEELEQIHRLSNENDSLKAMIEDLREQFEQLKKERSPPPPILRTAGIYHLPRHPIAARPPSAVPETPTRSTRFEATPVPATPERAARTPTPKTESPPFHKYHNEPMRLKTADLPKFSGKPNEDIDIFIGQMDTVLAFTKTPDEEILRFLPLILTGAARNWLTRLGDRRLTLVTWED